MNTEIKERDAQRHMTFKHLNKQKHSMSSLSKYEGIRNSAEIQYFDQTIVYDTKKAAGVSGNKYAKQPDYHKLNLRPMQYRSNSNNARDTSFDFGRRSEHVGEDQKLEISH